MATRDFSLWGWLATILCAAMIAPEARADIPPQRRPTPKPVVKPPAPEPTPAADPEPGPTDAAADPRPAEPEKAVRLATDKADRLADGLYTGALVGTQSDAELQLTVVRGFIVEAFVRRSGAGLVPFDLSSVGVANATGIRLQGSEGNEFVRVNGEIIDAERGRGTFDGVLVRKQVSGTWSVTRR